MTLAIGEVKVGSDGIALSLLIRPQTERFCTVQLMYLYYIPLDRWKEPFLILNLVENFSVS